MGSLMGITCTSGFGSLIGNCLQLCVLSVVSMPKMLSAEAALLNEVESLLEHHFHILNFIDMDHTMHMSQEIEVLRGAGCPDGHHQFTTSFG